MSKQLVIPVIVAALLVSLADSVVILRGLIIAVCTHFMSSKSYLPCIALLLILIIIEGHHHHDTNLGFSKVNSGNSASLQLNLAALTEELLQLDTENNVIYKKYAAVSPHGPPLVIFSTAANRNAAYNLPTIKTLA
ncbi:hypothetical protein Ocin01_13151 [Orchesella cincta]|uniref:Uncharacterized protein n=1 Tax=Orchesella cincta TaxID=48709 RepID=A0A1D2MKU6_ORCCI|nr:hypothetical protein Ocin01_13151 [Orchesella cincta]